MKVAKFNISPVNVEARKTLDMRAGDTVRVSIKIEEKGKTRLQVFEGTVLGRKGGTQPGATFTVRRISGGYGVEKIFPLYAPTIEKIEVIRRVKTRRAKLYHIRDKATREIKRQMRKMHTVNLTTDVPEPEAPVAAEEAPTEPEVSETPAEAKEESKEEAVA